MSVPVVMPQLGLTMTEGSVAEWLKKPGEMVAKGEMLFVVSTDKADMEVESLDEGKLVQIVLEPGKVVPVGTVIAYLGGKGDEIAAPPPAVAQAAAPPPPPATAASPEADIKSEPSAPMLQSTPSHPQVISNSLPSSPRARKIARELGVDISQVNPRAGSERIVEEDVRRFAESARSTVAKPAATQAAQPASKAAPDLRRRRLIAERLTKSIQTIPHFSVSVELRAGQLISLRESLKAPVEKQAGVKLTITDLLLKALGLALAETSGMRAVWNEGDSQAVEAIDLGLAIFDGHRRGGPGHSQRGGAGSRGNRALARGGGGEGARRKAFLDRPGRRHRNPEQSRHVPCGPLLRHHQPRPEFHPRRGKDRSSAVGGGGRADRGPHHVPDSQCGSPGGRRRPGRPVPRAHSGNH